MEMERRSARIGASLIYSAFWGGVGVPAIELLLLVLVPYRPRPSRDWTVVRARAGVGECALPDLRCYQHCAHRHWYILPGRELEFRVTVLRSCKVCDWLWPW